MKVYLYRNVWSGRLAFLPNDWGNGYYSAYHAETGLPCGNSWHILECAYDVPGGYETIMGQIMVPYGTTYIPWDHIWPHKPAGSTKV